MIDKNKIKLMTIMAVYDKNHGDKDRQIEGYYKNSYIYKKNCVTRIGVIFGIFILFCFYVLDNLIDTNKYDYVVQDKNSPVFLSLAAMAECKHFIIGNTTFGWWAQYLSEFENKMVIAPSKWMAIDMPIDIYQNNWILIEV